MRIKGYAIVTREEAELYRTQGGGAVIFTPETLAALGGPGSNDILLAFTTSDPEWREIICLTDVPKECADPQHLVTSHADEIEELLIRYKMKA